MLDYKPVITLRNNINEEIYLQNCFVGGCIWKESERLNYLYLPPEPWSFYQCEECGNEMAEITYSCTACYDGEYYGYCEYGTYTDNDSRSRLLHQAIGDMIYTYYNGFDEGMPKPCNDFNEWRFLLDLQGLGKDLLELKNGNINFKVWYPITPPGRKLMEAIELAKFQRNPLELDPTLKNDINELQKCVAKQNVTVDITRRVL